MCVTCCYFGWNTGKMHVLEEISCFLQLLKASSHDCCVLWPLEKVSARWALWKFTHFVLKLGFSPLEYCHSQTKEKGSSWLSFSYFAKTNLISVGSWGSDGGCKYYCLFVLHWNPRESPTKMWIWKVKIQFCSKGFCSKGLWYGQALCCMVSVEVEDFSRYQNTLNLNVFQNNFAGVFFYISLCAWHLHKSPIKQKCALEHNLGKKYLEQLP